MGSLFTSIQSHVNWTKAEPEENMFTSVLSAVLDRVGSFRDEFLSVVLHEKPTKGYRVLTQEQLPAGIISDIMLVPKNVGTSVIIENKLRDVLRKEQLNNYMRYIKENRTQEIKLVVISYYGEELLERDDPQYKGVLNLRWWEIYEMVKRVSPTEVDEGQKYILSEFLKYMEVKNMAPFSGLRKEELTAGSTAKIIHLFISSISEATKGMRSKNTSIAFDDGEESAGIYTGLRVKGKEVYFDIMFSKKVQFAVSVWDNGIEKNNKLKKAFVPARIFGKSIMFNVDLETERRNYFCYTNLSNLVDLSEQNGQAQKEKFIKNIKEIIKILERVL